MGFRVKVKLYDKLLSIFLIFIGQEGSSVSNSTLTHTLTHTHTHTHTLSLSLQAVLQKQLQAGSLEAEAGFS